MRLGENLAQRPKGFINVFVLLVALFSVSRRSFELRQASAFEAFMLDTLAPMQRSITYLKSQMSSFFENYLANVSASKENVGLRKRILELDEQIFSLNELERENKRLKALLEFGEEIASKSILAQVVGWDSSSDFRVLRINKGRNHGLRIQNPVITSLGLVGYVYRLTDNFADVLTILDSNNRVDAILKRTRSHGIIEGSGNHSCSMKYVNRTEPILLGDIVLTSGLGNIYPKGVKVGRVSLIERESYGMTQYVEIEPLVNFHKLEEVSVLISRGRNKKLEAELSALETTSKKEKK